MVSFEIEYCIAASTFMSIPFAKNRAIVTRSAPGDGLDVVDEPAVPACGGLADVHVLDRGGVRLELALEHRMVFLDGNGICFADCMQRVGAGLTGSRRTKRLECAREAVVDHGDEELLLRAEEAEEVGLRDAARRAIASVDAP